MCYQSVCYSASSIVDFECQNIIVKQPLLAIVITKPLITIVVALFHCSVCLVEFDLKSGKAQKEIPSTFLLEFSKFALRQFFLFVTSVQNCIEK